MFNIFYKIDVVNVKKKDMKKVFVMKNFYFNISC